MQANIVQHILQAEVLVQTRVHASEKLNMKCKKSNTSCSTKIKNGNSAANKHHELPPKSLLHGLLDFSPPLASIPRMFNHPPAAEAVAEGRPADADRTVEDTTGVGYTE